jgi:hypothetical protein
VVPAPACRSCDLAGSHAFTFDGKDAFAGLVEAEYLRRGGEHSRQVVAIGDGAAWIWGMAEELYPHATHIVDIWHAREHLHDLADHLAFIALRCQRASGRWDELWPQPTPAPAGLRAAV